jgi:hypothetical protein
MSSFHPSRPTSGIATYPLSTEIWRYPIVYLDQHRSDRRLDFGGTTTINYRVEHPEVGEDT